ncbi:MAG: DNA mismatch repair protein MutS [Erysipelotrichaceae bacterium]
MVKNNSYSPMISHYLDIKEGLKDTLVFYRLGDFYEMFFDDAIVASKVLDLVLTGRSAGVAEKVPMCGVPAHAVENYLNKLVAAGYKVAIVEQTEAAYESKGIVKREVVRIVTPGTNFNSNDNSFIALVEADDFYYLALVKIAEGKILLHKISKQIENLQLIINEYQVAEIVSENFNELIIDNVISSICSIDTDIKTPLDLTTFIQDQPPFIRAVNLAISYLKVIQPDSSNAIVSIEYLLHKDYLHLSYQSKLNLEIIENRNSEKKISLFNYLNNCKSALGSRALKHWVENPLRNLNKIQERLNIIDYLNEEFTLKYSLIEELKKVYDLQRISAKLAYKQATSKDLLALKKTLYAANTITEMLSAEIFQNLVVKNSCLKQAQLLDQALSDEADGKEGSIFKQGYNEELDHYRNIRENGERWIYQMEESYKQETGIKTLKIGYNKVYGYYIEISKGALTNFNQDNFIRKQTLVNAERFITEKLKTREEEIIQSADQAKRIEKALFEELVLELTKSLSEFAKLAVMLGSIDALTNLAEISNQQDFVRPIFNNKHNLEIIGGKHPILAKELSDKYVANDCIMSDNITTLLISGPNMGGKSTYIRQIALNVIMAQMGCYVCADKANLPVFDQIFTRIGASDDITSGQSTFMMEMNEANLALQNATENSLILFDELGRGTSTYDGMSLAQAMIEYINTCLKAKTLFSTHYHELSQLEDSIHSLKNVSVKVKENNNKVTFLYKVEYGKANKSYGINVAKLANLPNAVILRANTLVNEYEKNHSFTNSPMIVEMISEPQKYKDLKRELAKIDVNGITPIKALSLLEQLKKIVEEENE